MVVVKELILLMLTRAFVDNYIHAASVEKLSILGLGLVAYRIKGHVTLVAKN